MVTRLKDILHFGEFVCAWEIRIGLTLALVFLGFENLWLRWSALLLNDY